MGPMQETRSFYSKLLAPPRKPRAACFHTIGESQPICGPADALLQVLRPQGIDSKITFVDLR